MAESVIVIDLCRVAERGYIKSLIDAELRERLRAAISSDDAEMVCTWGRDCHRPAYRRIDNSGGAAICKECSETYERFVGPTYLL